MLEKIRVLIKQTGFQVVGQGREGAQYIQEWALAKGQGVKQLSGRLWQEANLTSRWIQALEQIVIASTRLARNYQEGLYGLVDCVIMVGPGYVEAYLNQGKDSALWLRQEWDQYRQLKPLHVLGDFRSVSSTFLEDFREACFGRYGLLARTMEQHEKSFRTEPMLLTA